MDTENNRILMKEFVENYKYILYWPMKIVGFVRFDLKDNKIVKLTFNTLIYRALILVLVDLGVSYLLYMSVVTRTYLKVPDGFCLMHFLMYANLLFINLTFLNRNSGLLLLEKFFNIDSHLGLKECKFIRDMEVTAFIVMWCAVAITNVTGGVFLYNAYDVSMTIHVIGSLFFFWLVFCYDDYGIFLLSLTSAAIRTRYLNVALAKAGGVDLYYVSSRSIMNVLFWKKSHEKLVTFQCRVNLEDFTIAYKMIFEILNQLYSIYRFPILLGVWTIVMGTFTSSQTFIECIKHPKSLEKERTFIIIGWSIVSWGFMLIVALFQDLVLHEMEQTKLLCAYIQLKPNKPENIHKLTKILLQLLEMRNPTCHLYNLFYVDAGFILKMAETTLIYLTVQLQLAFPDLPNLKSNVTSTD